ncbi:hypothetical protein ANN_05327 [Periplaneta americana]|uniref:Endonuclease/exonuclease/phosphatase domain-containing protein n=1 Tax=Periplaneta americana TaxID=6978 RepID=A0ABQ8TAT1_PERAM|nr:hypothetical protein ANN_05327 [Periplaneta americana]
MVKQKFFNTCMFCNAVKDWFSGLGFRPTPPDENVESTLIWYKGTDPEQYQFWTKSLEEFLKVYRIPGLTPGRGQNIYNCDYDRPPNENQVCDVDVKNWFPCTQENSFNFHKSAPCIFIKLNKIYDWRPEFYNDTNDLPEKMPKDLKDHIVNQKKINSQLLNTIWISCEGESPADIENVGPIKYIPRQGFPGYFYPYKNSEGYLSPVMAIHFERPRRDGLQIWRVAANILNKQSWTADKGWSSSLGLGEGLTTHHRKKQLVTKPNNKPQNGTDSLARPQQRNVVRFATWNVTSLYRTAGVTLVAKELARYRIDFVGVQEDRWCEIVTDIIRNIKSRRLRWAGHVACMGESRNAYKVLVGRPEGKRPLGRPRRRWEDNIKMDLREVGYDDGDWINLAQDRDLCEGGNEHPAGILINIECKAWARNIVHDRQERVGMVHFELMID